MSEPTATVDRFFGFTRDHAPGREGRAAAKAELPTARVEEAARKASGNRALAVSSAALIGAIGALLDIPLRDVIVRAWNEGKLFQKYLDPEHYDPEEVITITLKKHEVTSKHRPKIDVELNGRTIDSLHFELDIALTLEGIMLDIQGGNIRKIRAGRVKGRCVVTCEDLIVFKRTTEAVDLPVTLEFPARDASGD